MLRVLAGLATLFIVALGGLACAGGDDEGGDGRLPVVATTAIIAALADEIGGDRISLTVLIPAGTDPHEFELRSRDRRAIDRARVLLRHGVGLDAFLDDVVKPGDARATTVTDNIRARVVDGETDPHAWHDADNVAVMIDNIARALAAADPDGAPAYEAAAAAYRETIAAADREARALIETVPPSQRVVVTNHDSLGYFLDRYGIRSAGSVIPGLSTAADPSAKDIADLVGIIRSEGVRAILAEGSVDPKIARQLAADTGVRIVDDLFGDTLGPPGSEAATVHGMLVYNARRISDALR